MNLENSVYFSIDFWYHIFRDNTVRTRFISAPSDFVDYMLQGLILLIVSIEMGLFSLQIRLFLMMIPEKSLIGQILMKLIRKKMSEKKNPYYFYLLYFVGRSRRILF